MNYWRKLSRPQTCVAVSAIQHPMELIEPEGADDDIKATVEAFNTIFDWVLEETDVSVIGRRAICIHLSASRRKLPRRGLFRSLENDRIEQMLRHFLLTILGILVDPSDFRLTGRKTVALFHLIRKELHGARSLADVAEWLGCKKQAVSQSQKRIVKKLNQKLEARRGDLRKSSAAKVVL